MGGHGHRGGMIPARRQGAQHIMVAVQGEANLAKIVIGLDAGRALSRVSDQRRRRGRQPERLVREADGGNPTVIDGGYELNGWLNFDTVLANAAPHGCDLLTP